MRNGTNRIMVAIVLSSLAILASALATTNVYAFTAHLSPSSIRRGTSYIRVTGTGFSGEGFVRIYGATFNPLYANTVSACVSPVFYSNVSFVPSSGNFSENIPTAMLAPGNYGVYLVSVGPTGNLCLHFTVTS